MERCSTWYVLVSCLICMHALKSSRGHQATSNILPQKQQPEVEIVGARVEMSKSATPRLTQMHACEQRTWQHANYISPTMPANFDPLSSVRYYVGVCVGFAFHVLPITFTQWNFCCIATSTTKHLQKPDWKVDLPWFSYGYQTCVFVGFFMNWIHMSSLLCLLLSVEWLFMCEDVVRSLSNMFFFIWCLLFDPRIATYLIEYRGPIKKTSHLRPIYIKCMFIGSSPHNNPQWSNVAF